LRPEPLGARKPFNVTLIHPPGFVHSLALEEAADYVHAAIEGCGYRAVRTTNFVADDAYNVMFCAHLLVGDRIAKIPPDTIIFNSEALEDAQETQHYSHAYSAMLERFFVWDYSSRNLALIPHADKLVIPFLYCARLKRTGMVRESGPELVFYGRVNERRASLLDELRRRGVPVRILFGEYGAERDAHMLRARAVLNLHKTDRTLAFEPIRCFYPLINDVPVISEPAIDESANPFQACVFFVNGASVIEDIVSLYRDHSAFGARSREMLAEFKRRDPLPSMASAIERFLARRAP
jgi:hypothetical protein